MIRKKRRKVQKRRTIPVKSRSREITPGQQELLRKTVSTILATIKHLDAAPQPEGALEPPSRPEPVVMKENVTELVRTPLHDQQLRILLIFSLPEENWRLNQAVADQLQRLTGEVIAAKAYPHFSNLILRHQPDLFIYVGKVESLGSSDLEQIRSADVYKVAWLSDEKNPADYNGAALRLFNQIYTQNAKHLELYHNQGISQVSYLPFAADPSMFYQKKASRDYCSDILIVGDVLEHEAYASKITEYAYAEGTENLKIVACGEGWESYPRIISLQADSPMQEYYNGAEFVIQWQTSQRGIFEANACGAFQLIEACDDLKHYMLPGEDCIVFHSPGELYNQLAHYQKQPELKRRVATRALWRSNYNYSFLQLISGLLRNIQLFKS